MCRVWVRACVRVCVCVSAGVSFPDKTFGKESRVGIPFVFLLRDILQFDNTLNASITRIETAHRTCDLILGVGDGKSEAETVRGFEVRLALASAHMCVCACGACLLKRCLTHTYVCGLASSLLLFG
mgnify:CR=1 FL=1